MDRVRCLSETELERLLAYVQERADVARRRGATRSLIDEVLVLLLVNAGLRATELCNLTIGDLATAHDGSILRVRDASGNVSRAVEVTSEMAAYLHRFIELYRQDAESNDPLLVNERGARLAYVSIFSKVKRIGRQAGVGKLHPSILRSTYVVRLYDREQDLRFVQRQAGHASPRTTAIYAIAARDRSSRIVPPDGSDSEVALDACHSRKQPATEKGLPEQAASHRETALARGLPDSGKCEACGKQIRTEDGTRIDSGQILCPGCLKELHSA
jgi:integrase/recombinase XerD